jgi:isoleucyl-tRNA synthetase
MSKKKAKESEDMVEIPHEYLIEGVKKAVEDVLQKMKDDRRKYGSAYNWNNIYETFGRRFGYHDAEKIWAEFSLVWDKKSTQPSNVRSIIKLLGDKARLYAISRMQEEARAEKPEEQLP